MPDLFERFTRSKGSRSIAGGTGLGLAIARSYARAHGGDLVYEDACAARGMLPARPADGKKGAGIDRWEEGFDSWTPRRGGRRPTTPGVDLDREALLRLARELAEKRHAEQEHAGAELERLKQSLRERAEAIAARERELAELQKRLGEGKPRKQEAAGDGGHARRSSPASELRSSGRRHSKRASASCRHARPSSKPTSSRSSSASSSSRRSSPRRSRS